MFFCSHYIQFCTEVCLCNQCEYQEYQWQLFTTVASQEKTQNERMFAFLFHSCFWPFDFTTKNMQPFCGPRFGTRDSKRNEKEQNMHLFCRIWILQLKEGSAGMEEFCFTSKLGPMECNLVKPTVSYLIHKFLRRPNY